MDVMLVVPGVINVALVNAGSAMVNVRDVLDAINAGSGVSCYRTVTQTQWPRMNKRRRNLLWKNVAQESRRHTRQSKLSARTDQLVRRRVLLHVHIVRNGFPPGIRRGAPACLMKYGYRPHVAAQLPNMGVMP